MTSTPAAAAKSQTDQQLAQALADLDFNVSDEEINRAKQIWNEETSSSVDYSQIKSVTHPM